MSAGQHGGQNPHQHLVLADHHLPYLVDQLLGAEGYLVFSVCHSNASFVYIIFLQYT